MRGDAGVRRAVRRVGAALLFLGLIATGLLLWAKTHPASLDLGETAAASTGRALAALRRDPGQCRALLGKAGIRYTRLGPRDDGPRCGYNDAVRLNPGGAFGPALFPDGPPLACPVAAALAAWHWSVIQPAARRYLGSPVIGIEHLGSYNCRHIAGSTNWSEHATADAFDIAGFRLADGRRIDVLSDWRGSGPEATFLHHVRSGACAVFATVLSPDYNAAHRDHLHLDQAARGAWGGRACR